MTTPPIPRMLGRAARLRCPRCGGGPLFRGWFRMAERCPVCGYRFERQVGFAPGAMSINIGATIALFAVIVIVGVAFTAPDIPVLRLTIVAAGVNAVFPVVFYPFSKAIWAAIDLAMRPLDPAEEADAAQHARSDG